MRVHNHLVVYPFEDHRFYHAAQGGILRVNHLDVLRADHNIYPLEFAEPLVHTVELPARKLHQAVLKHHSVQNIALSDKISDKRILRFIINILRASHLLDVPIIHNNDGIRHGERFLLVMGHINEGDFKRLLYPFQLNLHLLAQLEVQRPQRFIQQQYPRMVDQRACNRDPLLLSARKLVDVAAVIPRKVYQLQHLLYTGFPFIFRYLAQLQPKLNIFKYIQMRKQCIALEHRIDIPFMRRQVVDPKSVKKNVTRLGMDKSTDRPEGCGLSTAGRAKQGNELLVTDVEIQSDENGFPIKIDRNVSQAYNIAFFHLCIPLCGI